MSGINPSSLQEYSDPSAFMRVVFPDDIIGPDECAVWVKATARGFPAFPFDGLSVGAKATHFSTALIKRAAQKDDGTITRSMSTFAALVVVVLDDVLEKVPEPVLPPSFVIETTPPGDELKPTGSYQYGYLLSEPVEDINVARQMLKSLAEGGLTDPAGVSPVKVLRLPGSQPPGKRYKARLVSCHPERLYDPATLVEQFGVAQAALDQLISADAIPAPDGMVVEDSVFEWLASRGYLRGDHAGAAGFWDIACPWAHLHTDPSDDEAGYKPASSADTRRAFKCFHQHGDAHGTKEFLQFVCDEGGPCEPPVVDPTRYLMDRLAQTLQGDPLLEQVHEASEGNLEADEAWEDVFDRGLRDLLEHAVADVSGKVYLIDLPGCPLYPVPLLKNMYAWATRYEEQDNGKLKAVNPVTVWLNHPQRKLTSRPAALLPREPSRWVTTHVDDRGVHGVVNAYRPRPLGEGRDPYDVEMFCALVDHVAPEDGDGDYLLDWIASKVQHPWRRQVAVVSITPTFGTGRSSLFRLVGDLLGPGNTAHMTAERLFGSRANQFNSHLEKLLITVSEVETEGQGDIFTAKGAFNRLKDLVDPDMPSVHIERKGAEGYTADVFASYLIASNSPGAIPLVNQDRRFTVLRGNDTPLRAPGTMDVIRWLAGMDDPQRASLALDAIQRWLLVRDVSAFEPSVPRHTSMKDEAIEDAKSPVDRAIEVMLHSLDHPRVIAVSLLAQTMKSVRSPVHDDVEHLQVGKLGQQIGAWAKSHGKRVKWIENPEGRIKVKGVAMSVRAIGDDRQVITDEKHGRLELERFVAACDAVISGAHLRIVK